MVFIPLISCTFSENNNESHEKAVLPSLILENATYQLGQSGENPISINSARITFYSDDNSATIENFSFQQIDDDGNIAIEGRANHGELNTNTKAMNLEGEVVLMQLKEEMEIEADSLYFSPEDEEISSNDTVVVKSKSGDFAGTGFFGDLREQTYSFVSLDKGAIAL